MGWNFFASKASTDGYQMAAYNVPHFIAQSIKFKTKYNINNLEPIANWGADPAVLVVNKNSKFNSVKEMAAWAKDNPGKVTVSGAGLFVGHHIAFLQIQNALGVKLSYVPHKGGAPALKSVLGGQVMAGVNNLSDAYRSRGSLKILGIADLKRDKQFLPDVPTFKEQGYAVDDSSVNFRGIMVRKGTPQAVIDKLAGIVPKNVWEQARRQADARRRLPDPHHGSRCGPEDVGGTAEVPDRPAEGPVGVLPFGCSPPSARAFSRRGGWRRRPTVQRWKRPDRPPAVQQTQYPRGAW